MLCLFRIFLKALRGVEVKGLWHQDPPALRSCFPKLKDRLGDEDQVGGMRRVERACQGVLTATVNTFLELARKNAKTGP